MVQFYSLNKNLKKFDQYGHDLAILEMSLMHDRTAFKLIRIDDLSLKEKKRAAESLRFLVEEDDGRVKAQTCPNGLK